MKTVCCIGHFGGSLDFFDGQTVKTKNIFEGLKRFSTDLSLSKLDTFQWKKKPFSFLKKVMNSIKSSDIIVVSVSLNGLRILIPLIVFINIFYRKRVHYFEIGGSVYKAMRFNIIFEAAFKHLTSINLENHATVNFLRERGFHNAHLVKNFKFIDKCKAVSSLEGKFPLNLIYFARVSEKKGVLNIIAGIRKVNHHYNSMVFTLDIYGAIEEDFKKEFFSILESEESKAFRYLGTVPSEQSVEVIKDYFLLVFPTKHFDEGIPGTLIDSLYAGVPILSSRYGTCCEVIREGVNGITYNFEDDSDLFSKLKYIFENRDKITLMKKNCLTEADKYSPEVIMADFLKRV